MRTRVHRRGPRGGPSTKEPNRPRLGRGDRVGAGAGTGARTGRRATAQAEGSQGPCQVCTRQLKRQSGPAGPPPTAEGGDTNTSGSEYLSANDSLQTACTDSSRRNGARGNASASSTDTKRTSVKRRTNSSSSTSTSSLEDFETLATRPRQSPAPSMTASGSTTPTSSTETIALSRMPGGSGPLVMSTPATPTRN